MPVLAPNILQELKHIVGKSFVLHTPETLATYECDALVLMKSPPDAVVLPANTQEVAAVVKVCARYEIPFIARGSGTGLSGGVLPVEGGIFIGLSRMNHILEIDSDNHTATIETGVINAWLNREAQADNLFYAPDPSSQGACTIGGNIAENAGGIHCMKYGVTTDHILGLEVVTPDGDIVWLGGKHGQYCGVNWMGLFVGSEGTFGIATKAIVRLIPIPQKRKVFLAAFSQVEHATDFVSDVIAAGLKPAAMEFMDEVTVKAVNQAFQMGFPEDAEALLLIELDGTPENVEHTEERLMTLLNHYPVTQLRAAEEEAERLKLWKARKGAVAAYGRILPAFYLHDCVIPRSELTNLLRQIQAIAQKYNVIVGNVFHAGDGNLHPNILFDPKDEDLTQRVLVAGEEILKACIDVGGVLSGEHGIGVEKSEFMSLLFTPMELSVMQRLKQVFDPKNLANPSKIFPMRSGCGEVRQTKLLKKMVHSGTGWI